MSALVALVLTFLGTLASYTTLVVSGHEAAAAGVVEAVLSVGVIGAVLWWVLR